MIDVVAIDGKGRGLVARQPIRSETIIETAPVKPFAYRQEMPKELIDLPMAWTDEEDCICMGVVQFANHSENPNCRVERDIENLTMRLIALRDISVGEELCYRYACPVWFVPKESTNE